MKAFLVRLSCLLGAVATAKETKIAFGSCNKQVYGGLWKQIVQEAPDYLVLLGDNVYNDQRNNFGQWQPASVEAIQNSYKELSEDEGWSMLSSNLGKERIFATWDDHDYGLDNGDRTFINREASLKAFLDFFHTDAADLNHRLKRGGVYKSHVIPIARGGSLKDFVVKVIMLDTRYFKDPKGSVQRSAAPSAGADANGADLLGSEQWAWLEAELQDPQDGSPSPDLILLGSSIQVLPTQKIFEETWSEYPHARQRLLNLVTNAPCPNVFLLSGDVHMMEVSQATCQGTNTFGHTRHLVELTSSGLSQTFINYLQKQDPGEQKAKGALPAPTILTKGRILQSLYDAYEASYPAKYRQHKFKDFYQGVHFSTLDIVLPDAGALSSEVSGVRFNVINHLGATVYSSFYPFVLQPYSAQTASVNAGMEASCDNATLQGVSSDNFVYNENGSFGFECTPHWGHENRYEYYLHVFCMACFMYVVLALPVLTILWLIFASVYYIWFITENKRRARIEAMHEKKD